MRPAVALLCLLLAACAQLPLPAGGTPAPTADPLEAAVATAEASGDRAARAQAYYERGNARLDRGDAAGAAEDYTRSLALDDSQSRAYNNRGLARATLGREGEALADYAAAIQRDPGYARAVRNRVALLERRAAGRAPAEADLRQIAEDYGRLAELEPTQAAQHRYRQGVALAHLRDPAARAALDEALRLDPRLPDAFYERALISFAAGDSAAAEADLTQALALSPRAANAYYARALAREALGRQADALADLDRATQLRPDDPDALLARASLLAALGRPADARADLDRLAALDPDPALAEAAARLRSTLP